MKTNLKGIAGVLILILLSVSSWGQGSKPRPERTAFENALIDSAYRYEKLKLAFIPLKTSYESQGKEVTELRAALRLSALQNEMQKQSFEAEIRKARESGGFWKGLKWGFGTGFGTGFLIGLSAHK